MVHADYIIWEINGRNDYSFTHNPEEMRCLRESQTWNELRFVSLVCLVIFCFILIFLSGFFQAHFVKHKHMTECVRFIYLGNIDSKGPTLPLTDYRIAQMPKTVILSSRPVYETF